MFAIVFQQVFIMFLLMLIGFVYAKATGMQKAECNRICNILLMIVTPCLLFEQPAAAVSAGNCQRTALFSGTCCCILTFCHFGYSFSLPSAGGSRKISGLNGMQPALATWALLGFRW